MNQLSGKYVNVVLSVEAGRGMEFLKNDVHITGNFCSRILESDKISACDKPQFNTELVWEVEKKDLRKIRSANQPLRVECITIDLHNRKERIGFTLLSLRSAEIIPLKNANKEVTSKWHKLIGCQADKKQCHPELYLSLVVRDHLINETDSSNSVEQMPYISEEDLNVGNETFSSTFPVVYLNDGYIQVGDDENASITFTLNLLVKEVVNLDTLLPEILVFQQNKEKYYLSFRILGVNIKTKSFRKELHNSIVLNEKVVVKLLSHPETLKEFFKTQNVTINFCCGQDKLGTTIIELCDIFTTRDSRCYFKFPSPNGMVPYGSTEKSPCISIETWLQQNSVEEFQIEKEEARPKNKIVFSNVPRFPSCAGDETSGSYVLDKLEKTERKAQSDTESACKEDNIKPSVTKSVGTIIKNIPLSPRTLDPLEVYKKYVLEVSLRSLVWKKSPKITKVIFKFLHPKSASYITIFTEISYATGELIELKNLDFKIIYISTQEKAGNLLNAWPPKLVLTDEKERSLNEEYEFNAVLSNNFCTEKDVVLKTARTLEPLAKVKTVLTWSEFGLEEPDTNADLILFPAVLDEVITVKEINDIEKWKAKERDRFDEALERVKETELNTLQLEWERKRMQIEEQLTKGVNKCKKLQETLQNKVDSFKIEKNLVRRRNNSNLYEEIFRENWKKHCIGNSKEVIELLSKSQRDNEHLKDMINESRQKIKTIEKSTLTKTQTSNLLQELKILEEKFEDAQTAKMYFKEQWKKACDEIHDLKREDLLNLQNRIQKSKEELSQLSLDKFTGSLNDQMENFSPSSIMSGRSSSVFF